MHDNSRRQACRIIAGSALAAATGSAQMLASDRLQESARIILVGPVTLAELLANADVKPPPIDGGPTMKAMLAAFKACHIYLVDQKVSGVEGTWTFTSDRSFPKVLVEGKLSFSLEREDKEAVRFGIKVAELEGRGMQLHRDKPEFRSLKVFVAMDTDKYVVAAEGGRKVLGRGLSFCTHRLRYGLNEKAEFLPDK